MKKQAKNSSAFGHRDFLAEMLCGEGAVRVIGKVVLMPQTDRVDAGSYSDVAKTAVFGAVVSPNHLIIEENLGCHEMWEGELILLPKRKYSSCDGNGNIVTKFRGYRIDQILCDTFGDAESWGRKYWESQGMDR